MRILGLMDDEDADPPTPPLRARTRSSPRRRRGSALRPGRVFLRRLEGGLRGRSGPRPWPWMRRSRGGGGNSQRSPNRASKRQVRHKWRRHKWRRRSTSSSAAPLSSAPLLGPRRYQGRGLAFSPWSLSPFEHHPRERRWTLLRPARRPPPPPPPPPPLFPTPTRRPTWRGRPRNERHHHRAPWGQRERRQCHGGRAARADGTAPSRRRGREWRAKCWCACSRTWRSGSKERRRKEEEEEEEEEEDGPPRAHEW